MNGAGPPAPRGSRVILGLLNTIDSGRPLCPDVTRTGNASGWTCTGGRSVLVRMSEAGEKLETIRISNDPDRLREVMGRAGEDPEVVLEACYGWYWAADTLAELGATVHLAHPLGGKMFSLRRGKKNRRGAAGPGGPPARG